MKVDITGRGFINGIGILPARGLEMSDVGISRLLNFNGVRVFDATTGLQITRATLDDMRKKKMEELKKQETKSVVVETPTAVVKKEEVPVEVVPEPPKFEATVTPYITEPVVEEAPVAEEPTAIEETPVEIGVDLAQNEDVVVEETVEADAPVVEEEVVTEDETITEETTTTTEEEKPFYGKKRNKKNRNK